MLQFHLLRSQDIYCLGSCHLIYELEQKNRVVSSKNGNNKNGRALDIKVCVVLFPCSAS